MTPRWQIDRRTMLAGLGAVPLVGCAPVETGLGEAPGEFLGLDALARRGGRRFGTAIASQPGRSTGGSIQNPAYTAIVTAECGLVVPENEMKWQTLRPGPATYNFTRMDQIVRWAGENGQAVRGHTLLWHRPQWFPEWLNGYDFGATPASEAERLLTGHITTVMERYGSAILSWDVVNEAIDHDRNAPIETSLSRAMGSPEAVHDLAFHTARAQAPGAQLVYNDYMSWEPQHAAHCADVLRLLEGFRERGTPVDALGIQSHIEIMSLDPATGMGVADERGWRAFLDAVVGMGYRLLITEFDVKDKALPGDLALRDAGVAEFARRYLALMLEYDAQLDDILAWGMVDGFNWLQGFAPARRDDALEVRSTPYSSDYRPKPLRGAIAGVLGAA